MNPLKLQTLTYMRRLGYYLSLGNTFRLPQSALRRFMRHVGGTIRVRDFDENLSIDLSLSECMQRRIFWMGYYNLDIVPYLKRTLQSGMVVMDIGANIGEISLIAAKLVGHSGRVIAFEPVNAIASELESNVKLNHMEQVRIFQVALSNTICTNVPIYASWDAKLRETNNGLGSLFHSDSSAPPLQEISTTTLDAWLSANPLTRLDLIKIDIEGAELFCLEGAKQTIQSFRPRLIVEVQKETAQTAGYKPRDILDFLGGLGYTFCSFGRRGTLTPIDADHLGETQNVLCLPANA